MKILMIGIEKLGKEIDSKEYISLLQLVLHCPEQPLSATLDLLPNSRIPFSEHSKENKADQLLIKL